MSDAPPAHADQGGDTGGDTGGDVVHGAGGAVPDAGLPGPQDRARAAEALQVAFTRLAPQGSDAWNFLAAFTHLGDRYGPYHPGASALSDVLSDPAAPAGVASGGQVGRRGRFDRLDRLSRRVSGRRRPAPGGQTEEDELEEAMGHVVEAFRFLAARVATLEERLSDEDRPVEGAAWLVPARELGPWVDPVVDHLMDASPGGVIVHADCGEGELLGALSARGATAHGVEPRGAVALRALEQGCSVTIGEADEFLATTPAATIGGVTLSGLVDRLPVHRLLPLLRHCRRTLARGAPLIVISESVDTPPSRAGSASDLVGGRSLHQSTWETLLDRAGFDRVVPFGGPGKTDGRLAVATAVPS